MIFEFLTDISWVVNLRTPILTAESPDFRLVLTSTVSKLGLNSAPMPEEINELVVLVTLLMREDLICSESSALTLSETPRVIVSAALKIV